MMRIFLTCALLGVAGCGQSGGGGHSQHSHDHGSHGGDIIEVGSETAHIEFVHSESSGTVKLYITGPDAKTALAIEAPMIKLTTEAGPQAISTTAIDAADGKASSFTATHDAFRAHPLEGRITLSIGGKEYNPTIVHAHD